MDFLGVGPLELIFIIIIALVLIGPRDIGKVARSMGRFLNRLYKSDTWRMLLDTSRTLRRLPERLAREAALEELDLARKAALEELDSVQKIAQEIGQEIVKDVGTLDAEVRVAGPSSQDLGDASGETKTSMETQSEPESE
jgi:Sec-independent protein translocase protein TatA